LSKKKYVLMLILILTTSYIPASCQETIENRLDCIEAKIDTLLALQRGHSYQDVSYEVIKDSLNLLWGIASQRGTILDYEYFVINHNDGFKIPYWVACYLSFSNLQGTINRTNDFRADPRLDNGLKSELEDYRHSGYDRGHNAPAGAFKRSRDAMSTTFLLSNMSPQTPRLNRNIWRILEEQVRDMVREEGEAWIITGNLFLNPDSQVICPLEYIGPNHVAVPTHLFKAILSMNENSDYSMYAFLLPNQRDHIPGEPKDFLITVDHLEEIAGYDFFPELDDDIENHLESLISSTWP